MTVVYLDTNVFIQAFEAQLELADPARRVLAMLEASPAVAVTSELTLAELFAPTKASGSLTRAEKMDLYGALFDRGFVTLLPMTRGVLEATALLRESFAQKLPDAIHVASAMRAGCRYLMSSDNDAKRLPPTIIRMVPDDAGLAAIEEAVR